MARHSDMLGQTQSARRVPLGTELERIQREGDALLEL